MESEQPSQGATLRVSLALWDVRTGREPLGWARSSAVP